MITKIDLDGKRYSIKHNLPQVFGLSLNNAFINWEARVDKSHRNIENFCNYVISKDKTNIKCEVYEKEL